MSDRTRWLPLSDPRFSLHGLPWARQGSGELWRLPGERSAELPQRVRELMRYPAGGRVRFACSTSQLAVRLSAGQGAHRGNMSDIGARGLDVYADGTYWNSVAVTEEGEQEKLLFTGADRSPRELTIYLPLYQEIRLLEIGIDGDASPLAPRPFALPAPLVLYGSSIAQGCGACRPAMSYVAIMARLLGIDFVNLGFSGSGKAEREVVSLVSAARASCFLFDLGKSYGRQPESVYVDMLDAVRARHPGTPLVCVTPIFANRELYSPEYREISEYTRGIVRGAVIRRRAAGDSLLHLVEGLELLGPEDADCYHEGIHPTDFGYARLAERLGARVRDILRLPAPVSSQPPSAGPQAPPRGAW